MSILRSINEGFERRYGKLIDDRKQKEVKECDGECKDKKAEKELTEAPIYGLEAQYDSRKSFGGKAQVETDNAGTETLYSYNTPVVKIVKGKVTLLPKWDSSATTLRHVKEFLKQHDLKAESKEQIAKDYGAKVDEDCKKGKRQNRKMKISEGVSSKAYDFVESTDNYTDRVKREIDSIRSGGDRYTYSFLFRLKLDNDYFLGNGDGYPQGLFMGNVKDQISLMRGLYDALKVKPEWLTKDDIDDYEEKMVNYKKHHRNEYRIGYNPITGKKIELESCKKEVKECDEKDSKGAVVRRHAMKEACRKDRKSIKEYKDMGQDLGEYQKWVDYDMKRYHKISDKTMDKIKEAGLTVVKDQYGDYEVIAHEPVRECDDKEAKRRAIVKEAVEKMREKRLSESKKQK